MGFVWGNENLTCSTKGNEYYSCLLWLTMCPNTLSHFHCVHQMEALERGSFWRKRIFLLVFLNSLPWLAGVCVTFPDLGLGAGHALAVTVIHHSHGLVNDPSAGHDGSPLTWKPNQKPHPLINQNSKAWGSLLPLQMYSTTSARNLILHFCLTFVLACFGLVFFRKATNLFLNNHAIDCFTGAASWAFSF